MFEKDIRIIKRIGKIQSLLKNEKKSLQIKTFL